MGATSGPIKVAALQTSTKPRAYDENRARAERMITEAAAAERPQIIVMPELFLHGHGYHGGRNDEREAIDGPTLRWMTRMSRDSGAMLVGGINEEIPGSGRCHSTLLFVDGDRLIGIYRKRHPASAERLFLEPGHEDAVFDTPLGRIGLLTCFDMSFPDATIGLWRRGVDLLLVANAWLMLERMPFLRGETFEHHRVLPRALAMQLRAPVVVANLVGPTDALLPGLAAFGGGVYPFETEFAGESLVCDHMGVVLADRARGDGEGIVHGRVDLQIARGVREVTLGDAGLDAMREHIFGGGAEAAAPPESVAP